MPTHVEENLWPCSWERVYKLQVDFPLRHPEHYVRAHPDIADCVVQYDETQGDVRNYLIEFFAATEIHPMLRPVIKPHMLNWMQEAWWDQSTLSCKQKIKPNFLGDYFDITSEWRLFPQSDTETREVWTFRVECTLPAVGGFLAQSALTRGLASHRKTTQRYMEELRAERHAGE